MVADRIRTSQEAIITHGVYTSKRNLSYPIDHANLRKSHLGFEQVNRRGKLVLITETWPYLVTLLRVQQRQHVAQGVQPLQREPDQVLVVLPQLADAILHLLDLWLGEFVTSVMKEVLGVLDGLEHDMAS